MRVKVLATVFLLLAASLGHSAQTIVPLRGSEGSLDQWFYTIGVMKYGETKQDVERILASNIFCGKYRYGL